MGALFLLKPGDSALRRTGDQRHAYLVLEEIRKEGVPCGGERKRQVHQKLEDLGEPALSGLRIAAYELRADLVIVAHYIINHHLFMAEGA